jgi:predicted nucleic acid-binding protein
MKVADSSFIVEGLLKRKELLEEDSLLTLGLAVYEVSNAVWKHQCLLGDLDDGLPYTSVFFGLIESGKIRILQPPKELMEKAYSLAVENRRPVYNMMFVALSQQLNLELATFDQSQADLAK